MVAYKTDSEGGCNTGTTKSSYANTVQQRSVATEVKVMTERCMEEMSTRCNCAIWMKQTSLNMHVYG